MPRGPSGHIVETSLQTCTPCGVAEEANSVAAVASGKRVAIIGNVDLAKFRGWLIEDMVAAGHTVFACAPRQDRGGMERLAKAGAIYCPIALDRTSLNPWQGLRHLTALQALLRQLTVNVVLVHSNKAVVIGSLAAHAARIPKIFAIVEGLGYPFASGTERKRRLIRLVLSPQLKAGLAVCDGVFVLNRDDGPFLIHQKIVSPRQRLIQVNGTGIDLDYYPYCPPPVGEPRFLLIARLIRDKGVVEYVDAARVLRAKYPEARFRLLGPVDNHPSAICREVVNEWESQGLIEYLGETADVRPYLADCTVFVLPSYREGLPRTILEAMSMGRAVVTTDAPGCHDAVVDGINGFLVPVGDSGALAAAMGRFIESPELVLVMGQRGREQAKAHFDVRQVNAIMLESMDLC